MKISSAPGKDDRRGLTEEGWAAPYPKEMGSPGEPQPRSRMQRIRLRRWRERAVETFFLAQGIMAVFILMGILVLMLVKALPVFNDVSPVEFFTGTEWNPNGYGGESFGLLPMIVSTIMVSVGAMVIAVPVGIGCAAYLAEVAHPRVRAALKPAIEMLAGIPSVVVGFLGIVLVGPSVASLTGRSDGLNAINGSILLAVMALPTIVSLSEDAIRAVPRSYREASLALGAGRWQTLVRVTVPAGLSGITASVMLGFGRAIGETMTVLMATGNAPALPTRLTDSIRTLTATITIELGEVPYGSTHYHALFLVGLVLLAMTLLVNIASDLFLHKYQEVER